MPRARRPETPGPVLDHPVPTDEELYELLLLGLWYMHPNQQGGRVSPENLGRMANGIFTALVQIEVMPLKHHKALAHNYPFVTLVHGNCQQVRVPQKLKVADIRARAKELESDLFVELNMTELYAHALLVAQKGYRLYLTEAGYLKAEALRAKYPNLTRELFEWGWSDYVRRVRSSDMNKRDDDVEKRDT